MLSIAGKIAENKLCGQGLDEEILDHLDHDAGTWLLDLAGRGLDQSMLIMLDHDERGGDVRRFEPTC